jgi:hypothetical protein
VRRGGDSSELRVLASGGFTADLAFSALFVIERKTPIARIILPARDAVVIRGAAICAAGFAYDAEDGTLFGTALQWSIPSFSVIGYGQEIILPELPIGAHRLQLAATDRDGNVAQMEIEFRVAERPMVSSMVEGAGTTELGCIRPHAPCP